MQNLRGKLAFGLFHLTAFYSNHISTQVLLLKYLENGKRIKLFILHNCLEKLRDQQDFLGGAVVKNPPATAGDMGLSPGLGRSHMPWSN